MKIRLNINYNTHAGEELRVNIKRKDGSYEQVTMASSDDSNWEAVVEVQPTEGSHVDYYYSTYRQQTELRHEWQMIMHRLELVGKKDDTYVAYDIWQDMPEEAYLYSSAYSECINRRQRQMSPKADCRKALRIKVRAPQLRQGEGLYLVGEDETLGAWRSEHAVTMYEHENNEWVATIDAEALKSSDVAFKFIIKKDNGSPAIMWEVGENRTLHVPEIGHKEVVVIEMPTAMFDIQNSRFAGTAVPLFSLKSEGSFGVGDFGDLRQMINWVVITNQHVLQLLPINDTTLTHTWTDSYPYSCVSIYALHPMYVDLRQLPELKDEAKRSELEALRKELNSLPQIDYERVNNAKNEYMRLVFAQCGKDVLASAAYKKWFKEEEEWLVPYAQYCCLRDKYGTPDYSQWPDHNVWDDADRASLTNVRTKAYKEAAFYYYQQYILAAQMSKAHDHARKCNVVLKGDIPIGVNRYGCDAWMEPRYFNLNGQAGAPPDAFSADGQNWGFPTYNWNEMLKDDCYWWVRRFSNMAKYFDAYRIDHVLGFFRIWEVPMPYSIGLMGQFQPALGFTIQEIEVFGLHWDEQRMLKPCSEFDWDVLFLRDHNDPNKYHPRIASQLSQVYNVLSDAEKECYNRLYNDYFYRRNNHFWYIEAMKKLPRLVNATRMLVCAEDLGMVPDCVAWVMNELKILSLEIQNMPKETGLTFGKLHHNPYRSVCTISSHDTATMRMWWDEDWDMAQEYYRTRLRRGDAAPHPMPGWLAREIVYRHLACPSMLCILTLQDWLATDEGIRLADANAERINIPANPKHYWRYRMHITLEELMAADGFNYSVSALIKETRG